jgi:hypothetical protein
LGAYSKGQLDHNRINDIKLKNNVSAKSRIVRDNLRQRE